MSKLVVMNLNGTITQHKKPITRENSHFIENFSLSAVKTVKAVMTGADQRAALSQCHPDLIVASYGMEISYLFWEYRIYVPEFETSVSISSSYVTPRVNHIRHKFLLDNYKGKSFVIRPTGIVTIPLLGTDAPPEDRTVFDIDRSRRRSMLWEMKKLFPNHNVYIAGETSFDIVPRPYGKLSALHKISKYGSERPILYFGNNYGIGGSDSEIYHADPSYVKFVCVDNPFSFADIARREGLYC